MRASPLRRKVRLLAVAVAAALVVSSAGVVLLGSRAATSEQAPAAASSAPSDGRVDESAVPAPVPPAFTPPRPTPLGASDHVAQWAPVLRSALARTAPRRDAPVVTALETRTPEDTSNLVLALERATDDVGEVWVRVRLPVLPNDTTAWVPRSALGGYVSVRTHLVIDVDGFLATLYRAGRPVFRAPVGVGKPEWPTPPGKFYIRNKLTSFASPAYGPLAFGTSARSAVLTDWPAGGFVGIHGTDRPDLIPGRISHGCIRLRNEDILRLAELMPVGTPVTIG